MKNLKQEIQNSWLVQTLKARALNETLDTLHMSN